MMDCTMRYGGEEFPGMRVDLKADPTVKGRFFGRVQVPEKLRASFMDDPHRARAVELNGQGVVLLEHLATVGMSRFVLSGPLPSAPAPVMEEPTPAAEEPAPAAEEHVEANAARRKHGGAKSHSA